MQEAKGVYCAFDPDPSATPDNEFDDVFLVDMRDLKQGLYGIAYHTDAQNHLNGMVFLTDGEIGSQIGTFEALWDKALQGKK